ncbi:MAG: hypothetical protein WB821_05070 [Burkholderiaceae bacterium]
MTLPSRITHTALWLWALPLTLCGLPLWAWMYLSRRRNGQKNQVNRAVVLVNRTQTATVFIAYGAPMAWLLKRHPYGEMDAIAVGCCIFAQNQAAYTRTLAHELVHVQQALHWGPLFPVAYALNSVWQKCCGRCPYTNNYFERQANGACK